MLFEIVMTFVMITFPAVVIGIAFARKLDRHNRPWLRYASRGQ